MNASSTTRPRKLDSIVVLPEASTIFNSGAGLGTGPCAISARPQARNEIRTLFIEFLPGSIRPSLVLHRRSSGNPPGTALRKPARGWRLGRIPRSPALVQVPFNSSKTTKRRSGWTAAPFTTPLVGAAVDVGSPVGVRRLTTGVIVVSEHFLADGIIVVTAAGQPNNFSWIHLETSSFAPVCPIIFSGASRLDRQLAEELLPIGFIPAVTRIAGLPVARDLA